MNLGTTKKAAVLSSRNGKSEANPVTQQHHTELLEPKSQPDEGCSLMSRNQRSEEGQTKHNLVSQGRGSSALVQVAVAAYRQSEGDCLEATFPGAQLSPSTLRLHVSGKFQQIKPRSTSQTGFGRYFDPRTILQEAANFEERCSGLSTEPGNFKSGLRSACLVGAEPLKQLYLTCGEPFRGKAYYLLHFSYSCVVNLSMQKGYQSLRFSDRNNCNKIDCILVAGYNRQASVTLAAPVPETATETGHKAHRYIQTQPSRDKNNLANSRQCKTPLADK
ncbi:hypothetical protein Anapl_04729 [Anas platyrhynchos]|uniref:Uncharacterized protein n=1 Tax=Anas platyrhynchos TaxID=8839 RepID=R0K3N5_ANAPL|nr:hypothetical protein Anapl_04729 [Anas platyrhynchos]